MPEETVDSESTEGFSVHERRVPLALGQRDTRAGETILGETLTARPRAQGPERKARDARGRGQCGTVRGPSGTEREALSVSEPGRPLGRGRCARAAEPCCKREPGLQPVPPEPRASGLGWVGAQRLTHCVRGHTSLSSQTLFPRRGRGRGVLRAGGVFQGEGMGGGHAPRGLPSPSAGLAPLPPGSAAGNPARCLPPLTPGVADGPSPCFRFGPSSAGTRLPSSYAHFSLGVLVFSY